MNETKEKLNWQRLSIIIVIVVVTAAIVGGTVWYIMDQTARKVADSNAKSISNIQNQNNSNSKDTIAKIPENFTSMSLNGANIYYPTTWGTLPKEATKEDLSSDLGPGITFKGENATTEDYMTRLTVNDYDSYLNFSYISDTLVYLKEIYSQKTISPEKILALSGSGNIPPVNAATKAKNPKYIESNDGNWKGYWYLAQVSQGFSPSVRFQSVMYNEKTNKVFSVSKLIKTSQTDSFEKELDNPSVNTDVWQSKFETFLQSAYVTDSEMKSEIDSNLLPICEFVQ